MIDQLIVLADELDKCGEKEAANTVDKLIKVAIGEAAEPDLIPLSPEDIVEENPFDTDEPTKVEFASTTGTELVSKLRHFFTKHPNPMLWSDSDRAKVLEAMEVLKG